MHIVTLPGGGQLVIAKGMRGQPGWKSGAHLCQKEASIMRKLIRRGLSLP